MPRPRRSKAKAEGRTQELLGLFAWHRDAPLVARALGVSLDDLDRQLEDLKIRRKAYRLVRGRDTDVPRAAAVRGAPSGPPVRRRTRAQREPPPQVEEQPPQAPPDPAVE